MIDCVAFVWTGNLQMLFDFNIKHLVQNQFKPNTFNKKSK